MKKIKQLAEFLVEQHGSSFNDKIPLEIIQQLQKLNRAERGELKDLLFNKARELSQNISDGDVIFWLQNAFQTVEKYSFRMHKVFFSPGYDIMDNLRDLIEQSQETVDLCIFTITDSRLAEQIVERANKGVKFRIITDDQKMFDRGSEIRDLSQIGIPVKIDHSRYHMHNKFGIIDGRIIFTGSFNWTYTATKHNQENLVVTTNYDIVNRYKTEFERLWEKMFEL